MKNIILASLFLMSGALYAGGPKVKSYSSSASELSPGMNATVTVVLKGKSKAVKSMMIIVREFAYDIDPFVLSAVEDKKNKVWKVDIPVPYDAPSGTFNLELKVIMVDRSQLEIEESKGNAHGKAGTLKVTVI